MTSCKEREGSETFEQTLCELDKAGFKRNQIKVFIDGERNGAYGVVGNWILSAWELFLSEPNAHMYALFQDDIRCCPDLKVYIEKTVNIHRKVYLNLYTSDSNTQFVEETDNPYKGWHESNQMGRGALALVFSRPILFELLTSESLMAHAQSRTDSIDGAICTCLSRQKKIRELVHYPSLVQHLDEDVCPSTLKKLPGRVSPCFQEDFNPMEDC